MGDAEAQLGSDAFTIKVPANFAGRCREIDEFERLGRLGEGTFGIVCELSACYLLWSLCQ